MKKNRTESKLNPNAVPTTVNRRIESFLAARCECCGEVAVTAPTKLYTGETKRVCNECADINAER